MVGSVAALGTNGRQPFSFSGAFITGIAGPGAAGCPVPPRLHHRPLCNCMFPAVNSPPRGGLRFPPGWRGARQRRRSLPAPWHDPAGNAAPSVLTQLSGPFGLERGCPEHRSWDNAGKTLPDVPARGGRGCGRAPLRGSPARARAFPAPGGIQTGSAAPLTLPLCPTRVADALGGPRRNPVALLVVGFAVCSKMEQCPGGYGAREDRSPSPRGQRELLGALLAGSAHASSHHQTLSGCKLLPGRDLQQIFRPFSAVGADLPSCVLVICSFGV